MLFMIFSPLSGSSQMMARWLSSFSYIYQRRNRRNDLSFWRIPRRHAGRWRTQIGSAIRHTRNIWESMRRCWKRQIQIMHLGWLWRRWIRIMQRSRLSLLLRQDLRRSWKRGILRGNRKRRQRAASRNLTRAVCCQVLIYQKQPLIRNIRKSLLLFRIRWSFCTVNYIGCAYQWWSVLRDGMLRERAVRSSVLPAIWIRGDIRWIRRLPPMIQRRHIIICGVSGIMYQRRGILLYLIERGMAVWW